VGGFCALIVAQDVSLLMKLSCLSFWYAGISKGYMILKDALSTISSELAFLRSLSRPRLLAYFSPLAGPSGNKWVHAGSDEPAAGTELHNAALSAALEQHMRDDRTAEMVSFDEATWLRFGVVGLRSGHYVVASASVGGKQYFQPRPGMVRRSAVCCSAFWGNCCSLPVVICRGVTACLKAISSAYTQALSFLLSLFNSNPFMWPILLLIVFILWKSESAAETAWGEAGLANHSAAPVVNGSSVAALQDTWLWEWALRAAHFAIMVILLPSTAVCLFFCCSTFLTSPSAFLEGIVYVLTTLCSGLVTCSKCCFELSKLPVLCSLAATAAPRCRKLPGACCYGLCGVRTAGFERAAAHSHATHPPRSPRDMLFPCPAAVCQFMLACAGDACCNLAASVFRTELRELEDEHGEPYEGEDERADVESRTPLRPGDSSMYEA
jgi:hypothetical protein